MRIIERLIHDLQPQDDLLIFASSVPDKTYSSPVVVDSARAISQYLELNKLGHFSPDPTRGGPIHLVQDNGRVLPYLDQAKGGANDS